MNIISFIIILFFAVSVFGQTNATVTDGSGDGKYRGQSIVDVWANPNPPGMLFDNWIGDTALLERIDEWHTKLKTGTKTINLTATYKTVPNFTPSETESVGTTQMRYYFPPNPVGVVFHFHGTGGSLNGLFTQIEQTTYARELVEAGYAIVTLNSENRTTRQWSNIPTQNNPDIRNVQTAINTLMSRGLLTSQTPIFSSGISNGGQFSSLISFSLNFKGSAIYIAPGFTVITSQTTVPTIWCIAENDETIGASNIEQARLNYIDLRNRNITAEYNLLRISPVYPERFWRIPGLNANDSINIYNALKSNGFLDGKNYLNQNPTNSNWESVIPAQYNSFLSDIFDQLFICYAEHKFFSDYNQRVIKFFNSQL